MARMAEWSGPEEKKALRFIARREERGDPSPGLLEIGCAVGLEGARGVQGVQELLSRLTEDGYLVQDASWRRMLQLTGRGWRLVEEKVSAGPDGSLTENEEALHSADEAGRRSLRLLRVEPGSLIRAGMSGDELLVIEEEPEPEDGELVAALVGDEMLLKRLRRGGGSASLVPAYDTPADPGDGPAGEPPLPVSGAGIQGRVVYAIRPVEA